MRDEGLQPPVSSESWLVLVLEEVAEWQSGKVAK